ncbi:MAG: efflux RND transporter periplasmic adaptor subunit [Betaproteobacteria bacterium]|nr:efflux RND transporter periplasmic adaptor subunit [Betaproteobacteria bacterium]
MNPLRRYRNLLVGLAAVAIVMGLGLRQWQQRATKKAEPAASAPVASAPAPAALELGDDDTVTASVTELAQGVDVSGTVKAVNSAYVKARQPADILSVAVREGDAVRAGQVLAQQDPTEFDLRLRQAEQQAQAARAQLDIAQRTQTNNKALVAQGFISPTALEASTSNEAAALATLNAAQAAVDLARKAKADLTLRAPISGQISQRLAQPGERAAVDARILEIVDLSRLEIEVALAPEDVAALKVGRPARLKVDGLSQEMRGRVARINPAAQAGSRTVSVYVALDPHPALRQGLFARGRVELDRKRVLTVPTTAVRVDRARPYVLVLEGSRVVERPVDLGLRGDVAGVESVQVITGLTEGARVLTGRVGAVTDGTLWRSKPAAASAASAASR